MDVAELGDLRNNVDTSVRHPSNHRIAAQRALCSVLTELVDDLLTHDVELDHKSSDRFLLVQALCLPKCPRRTALVVKAFDQNDGFQRRPAVRQGLNLNCVAKNPADGPPVLIAHASQRLTGRTQATFRAASLPVLPPSGPIGQPRSGTARICRRFSAVIGLHLERRVR
jgi:hypothetical protein